MKLNKAIKDYEKAANNFETKRPFYQEALKIISWLSTWRTPLTSRLSIEYVRQQIEKTVNHELRPDEIDFSDKIPTGLIKCTKCGWHHAIEDSCVPKSKVKEINYENFGAKEIRGKTCDYVHIDDFVRVPNVKNGCTCDPDIPKSKLQEVLTDLSKEQEKRLKKAGLYKGVTKQVRKEIDERKKEIDLTWNAPSKNGIFKIYRNTNLNYLDLKRDDNGHFLPKYKTIATFVYPHKNIMLGRHIEVVEKDKTYIGGYDLNEQRKFKNFRKDRIIGKIRYERIEI